MITNLIVLLATLAGFSALMLAMDKHARQLLPAGLSPRTRRVLRIAGWLLLAAALALGMSRFRFDVGSVVWVGWLSVAGLALVFTMPRFVRETARKPARRKRRSAASGPEAAAVAAAPRPAARRPHKTALVAALLMAPTALFAWRLASVPLQPLLREDAVRGTIGPWEYVLAEREREAPHVVALGTPVKEFVIRFCEACDEQIQMAYLKLRKPRSLRAAGNGFEGSRLDRHVEIPVPPAATVKDGLWLTVQGRDGSLHEQELDITRLSPELARFLEERS